MRVHWHTVLEPRQNSRNQRTCITSIKDNPLERNIKTKTKLETLETGKIFSGKSKKNRTLLALKLENSILKNGKKNEHYCH